MIFLVELPEGHAAVHVNDIGGILPDRAAPKTRSVIYTGMFPSGISVEGDSEILIGRWMLALREQEGQDEYCDMCGEAPCICEPEENENES